MNYMIKQDKNYIAVTDQIEAGRHKHWLFQLFISSQEPLHIVVNEQRLNCYALLVNVNTTHQCHAKKDVYFTMLIDPTTTLGRNLRYFLRDQLFYAFPASQAICLQQELQLAIKQADQEAILRFYQTISFPCAALPEVDERIMAVLRLLDTCFHDDEHQVEYHAKAVHLSKSRLAHLFKNEIGVPLKSYIVLHKLQAAYDILFQGATITEAALQAGFDSPSHLAFTNKLMTGMSSTAIKKDSEFLKVI